MMAAFGTLVRIAAAASAMALAAPAIAEPTDTAVKAAFLPRFARYVIWPTAAMPRGGDPFVLCVIGGDPFGTTLDDAARSQFIDGRRIAVRRLTSIAGSDACQIAFIQGRKTQSTGQLIAALGRKPILTVTDAGTSVDRGIIHFSVVGGRVRFFIDQSSATRNGLTISSRLLALAIGVKQ